ncbi:MAG: hypothetical protein PHR84_00760 [Candidatus Omnitrophica bacterium]|nr:hypothetical protein [Candidatus Omnitrophota bacterium]
MGVVHKLKPEVIKFIVENKQNDPSLSCRALTQLVFDKLQIKLSKSSANAIIKENNLSMPIGRRQKHKKKKFNMPILPVIEGTKAITLVAGEGKVKAESASEEKRIKEAEEWAMKLQIDERAKAEERLRLQKQKSENEDIKKKAEEAELRFLMEEAAKLNAQKEAEKLAEAKAAEEVQRKAEQERLAKLAAEEAEKLAKAKAAEEVQRKAEQERLANVSEDDAREPDEENAAQEAALRAEKERWARLAEEELKARQKQEKEEVVLKKEDFAPSGQFSQNKLCSGLIFFKALDCLMGCSKEINAAICKELGQPPDDFLNLTETLIFRSLFDNDNIPEFWGLIAKPYPREKLDNYSAQVRQIKNIQPDIVKIISAAFTEARGAKVHLADGDIINLDGQLHSTWPTKNIPYDFSSSIYELKNNLNKYFTLGQPLVLFSAGGYDIPSKDFFGLLLNGSSAGKCPANVTLFGNNLEELQSMPLNDRKKLSLIFGLWPWQFTSSRKVKKIGDFELKHIEAINQDLYLAEVEIDLLRAALNQSITLKGCAVKTAQAEKIRMVILSSDPQPLDLAQLAEAYLGCWPNFEEAFHDFSRKIELFAYNNNTQKFFPKDSFEAKLMEPGVELEKIFVTYIKMLETYLRWHFFPAEYREKDNLATSDLFYGLPLKLEVGQSGVVVKVEVAKEYQFLKDLEYLICRLNERQIRLTNSRRLCFENAFK